MTLQIKLYKIIFDNWRATCNQDCPSHAGWTRLGYGGVFILVLVAGDFNTHSTQGLPARIIRASRKDGLGFCLLNRDTFIGSCGEPIVVLTWISFDIVGRMSD